MGVAFFAGAVAVVVAVVVVVAAAAAVAGGVVDLTAFVTTATPEGFTELGKTAAGVAGTQGAETAAVCAGSVAAGLCLNRDFKLLTAAVVVETADVAVLAAFCAPALFVALATFVRVPAAPQVCEPALDIMPEILANPPEGIPGAAP